jgi:hypothetical protein
MVHSMTHCMCATNLEDGEKDHTIVLKDDGKHEEQESC